MPQTQSWILESSKTAARLGKSSYQQSSYHIMRPFHFVAAILRGVWRFHVFAAISTNSSHQHPWKSPNYRHWSFFSSVSPSPTCATSSSRFPASNSPTSTKSRRVLFRLNTLCKSPSAQTEKPFPPPGCRLAIWPMPSETPFAWFWEVSWKRV